MKKKILLYIQVLLVPLILASSCNKFVEIPNPANQVVSATAFADDKSAVATLNGIYSAMMSTPQSLCASTVSLYAGMSADELTYFTASTRDGFIQNTISQSNNTELQSYMWTPAYNYIYSANSCLEGVAKSKSLSAPVVAEVTGEAYFIRAFVYFNLVNLFGGLPEVTGTDYNINKSLPRASADEITALIEGDLLKSISLLKEDYPSDGRARPNKSTARTLLAKLYLYHQQWQKAAQLCDSVIVNPSYTLESNLSNVFLSTSKEAIWQLAPVTPNYNTYVGNLIIPSSSSAAPTYVITPGLLAAFDSGDKRKTSWLQSKVYKGSTLYYPYKYKIRTGTVVTEYNMVFRLSEVYLMRAESRAELNDLIGSRSDLYVVRSRAGLGDLPSAISQTDLLTAIQKERRIELFSEWGNRWFDLKRTNTADAILGALKPTWKPTAVLYPIPYSQILLNPNLKQNDGYH